MPHPRQGSDGHSADVLSISPHHSRLLADSINPNAAVGQSILRSFPHDSAGNFIALCEPRHFAVWTTPSFEMSDGLTLGTVGGDRRRISLIPRQYLHQLVCRRGCGRVLAMMAGRFCQGRVGTICCPIIRCHQVHHVQ
jgi:hypothetical protein